jgi:exopolysaccharide biosynthesis polyprenyl glycosylphosphotransferase
MSAIGARSGRAEPVSDVPVSNTPSATEGDQHLVQAVAHLPSLGLLGHRRARRARRRGSLVRRMLVLADIVGLVTAYVVVDLLTTGGAVDLLRCALLLATLPVWVVLAKVYGLYDQDEARTHHPTTDDLLGVFHVVTVGTWVFYGGGRLLGLLNPNMPRAVAFWLLAIVLMTVCRLVARARCRKSLAFIQNTIVVGAGDVGQSVARKLLRHPEYGMNLVGFVDSRPKPRQDGLEHVALLGAPSALPGLVQLLDVERVVIAFSNELSGDILAMVRTLNETTQVQIDVVPRFFELVGPNAKVDTVEGLPLLELPPPRLSRSSFLVKRGIDIVGASVALIVTAPLFAYIAWRIKRDSPGPVFFRQTRLALSQRPFTALKFRTMKVDVDADAHRAYIERIMDPTVAPNGNGLYKLERDDAITPVGRWLRKTSLDELPQLINVLRGDMSLVGPRPCIPYETEHFLPQHFDRFLVPAGITGLWQVTARGRSTFREALDMDVAYARGWSLGLDLRLLCRTPLQVLGRKGAA